MSFLFYSCENGQKYLYVFNKHFKITGFYLQLVFNVLNFYIIYALPAGKHDLHSKWPGQIRVCFEAENFYLHIFL